MPQHPLQPTWCASSPTCALHPSQHPSACASSPTCALPLADLTSPNIFSWSKTPSLTLHVGRTDDFRWVTFGMNDVITLSAPPQFLAPPTNLPATSTLRYPTSSTSPSGFSTSFDPLQVSDGPLSTPVESTPTFVDHLDGSPDHTELNITTPVLTAQTILRQGQGLYMKPIPPTRGIPVLGLVERQGRKLHPSPQGSFQAGTDLPLSCQIARWIIHAYRQVVYDHHADPFYAPL